MPTRWATTAGITNGNIDAFDAATFNRWLNNTTATNTTYTQTYWTNATTNNWVTNAFQREYELVWGHNGDAAVRAVPVGGDTAVWIKNEIDKLNDVIVEEDGKREEEDMSEQYFADGTLDELVMTLPDEAVLDA